MNTYASSNDAFGKQGTTEQHGFRSDDYAAAGSGVSWGAILAGATAAAALTLIMVLLGAGMGLGLASPWEGQGAEAKTIGIAGVFWITFTQVVASGLGGYIAGRLRAKWSSLRTEEVGFRDTAHGFLAWAAATLVTAALLMSAAGATLSAGARAGASLASGAASTAAAGALGASRMGEDSGSGPLAYWTDSLLRKAAAPAPTGAAAPASSTPGQTDSASAPNAPAPAAVAQSEGPAPTAELGRIFANSLRTGAMTPEDTRYVAQVVAQRTGISQADAEKRVNDTFARAKATTDEAIAKTKEAADTARKTASYGSLWLFISLVIGALVAAYCATLGGRARDL
ncbi:hypothetical protein ACSFA0_24870 [Variovorax sp. LT1P1]|uniref:hypothetical protein n=1 Tax=Variovorax sp. LT1P1 TaxID=3443730 RepID=UPI003F4617D4